jgi:hypothetical protein
VPTPEEIRASIPSIPTPTSHSPAPLPASEEIRTLALRVNLTDASVQCTEQEIGASIFGGTNSVRTVYEESSRGALTISGDVTTVDIGYASVEGCMHHEWAEAADTAASAAGYSLSEYERLVYMMPRGVCRWGGNFSFGGERVWSLRCEAPKVVAHELGHTLGMYHASTESEEYGDRSDPMGGGLDLTRFNAPHLLQMGWLPETAVEDITVDGEYVIEATELDPNAATHPQVLRLQKPDTDEYYYVSFRRAIGLDASLAPEYRDTVLSVHRYRGFGFAPGYGPPKTYLMARGPGLRRHSERNQDHDDGPGGRYCNGENRTLG